ncbi:MAG: WbqC family protein [Bacteroidota bacterium]|nr:WbqC family protein [Bacteroidota bacterium]
MNILLHPTYFPSISHFVALSQAEHITFEVEDNFQKQTLRNRTYIYSANGKQLLNVPVQHSGNPSNRKYKDIRIDYSENWQKIHFKSLEMAYRSSPFFEYFEDDILPLFTKKHNFLMDYNYTILEVLTHILGVKINYNQTSEYHKAPIGITDYRPLVDSKKNNFSFEPYTQVFDQKHGFISDLSILDLIFNEGKYALDYLNNQKLLL